jgi:hypothetical protein
MIIMGEESEEIKELGQLNCPHCKKLIILSRRVVYDRPDPRRKVSEEYIGEKSKQAVLPHED